MFSTQVGQHFKCIESADLDFFPFESRKRSVSIIALTLLYACRLLIPFSDATDFTKSLLFIVSLLLKMLVHEIIKLLAVQGYVPLSCFPDTLLRTVTHLSRKNQMLLFVNKVRFNSQPIAEKDFDTPLIGKYFGIDDEDLVFIFLELMEEFKIKFTLNDVSDYKFNSINKIAETIENKFAK